MAGSMILLTITLAVFFLLLVLVQPHFVHNAKATTIPFHRSKQEGIGIDHPTHHELGLPDDIPEVQPPVPPEPDRVPFVSNQELIVAMHRPAAWHPAYYTSHSFVPLTLMAEDSEAKTELEKKAADQVTA